MIQLVPMLSTISRPVYQDRSGNLYLKTPCAECRGAGEFHYSPINPSERDYSERCDCCNGDGWVLEQTDEDELREAA